MATYAAYRHVELDRVGMGKKRVLKPPGGGSSISFGEEDNLSPRGNSTPVEEAPKNDNQEQQSPKAETNGTSSPPQTPKENGTNSVTENSPSTATNTATTNGVALNGTVTNGTTSGSSTPNSSRLDTQNRLFGQEPQKMSMSSRRVRDHHRSNIFSDSDENVPSKSALLLSDACSQFIADRGPGATPSLVWGFCAGISTHHALHQLRGKLTLLGVKLLNPRRLRSRHLSSPSHKFNSSRGSVSPLVDFLPNCGRFVHPTNPRQRWHYALNMT
ncbi:microtubule-associated protein Jupiter-like isoform X3 [Macrobrachium nipponense]|uniref:microtubule-associated protein Jupiter-like isoform X3 n=1 Tax=Macrobrachium nipponense TaxID=159736 RepID=UPI0030C87520